MELIIHVIDDEDLTCNALRHIFKQQGHQAVFSRSGKEALEKLRQSRPDLILLDLSLPDVNGIELLKKIKSSQPQVPVVMISGFGTIEAAVETLRLGARDFLTKPLNLAKVTTLLENLRAQLRLEKEVQQFRTDQQNHFLSQHVIGNTPVIQKCYSLARSSSSNDQLTVLITGESGTGKEFLARYIHYHSPRRHRPLVTVNCSALPKDLVESELFGYERGAFTGASTRGKLGKFELADEGTLFLDEIGDLQLDAQAKILRFLQEKELQRIGSPHTKKLNVRVLAATNRDLEATVAKGLFREDLFYRLNVMRIHLPPLRERKEDIPLFLVHFIQVFNREFGKGILGVTPEAERRLLRYDWPGNIRELRNIIERAVHLATGPYLTEELVQVERAPRFSGVPLSLGTDGPPSLREMERRYATSLLKSLKGNKSKAAHILGISRARLRRILEERELGEVE